MNIRTIVVATDLSDATRQCFPHAAAWSATYGAPVRLLHVSPSPSELGTDHESSVDIELLTSLVADLEALGVEDASWEIRHGAIPETVAAFVDASHADLLILAKHSTLLERILKLGSTANRILRHAEVPVLVVHGDDAPLMPAHILVAVDATERSGALVDAVMDIAPQLEAEVALVHAHEDSFIKQIEGPDGTAMTPQAAFDAALAKLIEPYKYSGLSARVYTGSGSPGALIVQTAAESNANLIAIASSGKGVIGRMLLGSTTLEVCEKAHVPVLVYPADWLDKRDNG